MLELNSVVGHPLGVGKFEDLTADSIIEKSLDKVKFAVCIKYNVNLTVFSFRESKTYKQKRPLVSYEHSKIKMKSKLQTSVAKFL